MDNSEFLSFFWGLSDEKPKAQIVQSAESIVNLVETKQKFENRGKEINKEKFKLYLNICENPSEDILYTFKRLIGGIASTGINARRGFALTFSLMTEKFSNILNFNEMVNIIEKETLISKSEKSHIKNCALSGKILMLKTLLEIKSLPSEIILNIFKILLDSITVKFTEEAILQILSEFLHKLKENFYSEISEPKRTNRFLDKFLNLVNKILVNKSSFASMKNLYEFSLTFTLLSYSDLSSSIVNFFPTSILTNLLQENSLINYFKLLLAHNIRDNEFHVSFKLLNNLLIKINDFPKVIEVWNILIDPNVQAELKKISQKNMEYLIYNFSKFLLESYFILKYMKQIFDSSFFDTLLKFTSNKKFKYIGSLVEILIKQMKTVESNEKENELKSQYASDLLQIFGEGLLSPQSYKSFFIFLFNNLNETLKTNFIEKMCSKNSEENDNNDDEEDLRFKISALKQLMVSGETEISKKLKNIILQFFFREFFNQEMTGDVEMESILEDRLMIIIFAYLRIPKEENNNLGSDEETVKTVKDTKVIKNLLSIHKILQGLISANEIEDFDMDDYKVYTKHLKKFVTLFETQKLNENSDKEKSEKLASIIKLGLVSLILFLKAPNEYSDVVTDLLEVAQFKSDWQKVYMDLIISLLHKGNNTLCEFVMNCFKKVSRYFSMDGFNVLIDFISQGDEKADIIMESDDESEVDNTGAKKMNGNGNEMFDDLVENGETDEISI